MTDKPHGQRMLSFLLRSARGALFRGVLVLFLVDPANAAVFTVNSPVDFGRDANPGDGVCETAARKRHLHFTRSDSRDERSGRG